MDTCTVHSQAALEAECMKYVNIYSQTIKKGLSHLLETLERYKIRYKNIGSFSVSNTPVIPLAAQPATITKQLWCLL